MVWIWSYNQVIFYFIKMNFHCPRCSVRASKRRRARAHQCRAVEFFFFFFLLGKIVPVDEYLCWKGEFLPLSALKSCFTSRLFTGEQGSARQNFAEIGRELFLMRDRGSYLHLFTWKTVYRLALFYCQSQSQTKPIYTVTVWGIKKKCTLQHLIWKEITYTQTVDCTSL